MNAAPTSRALARERTMARIVELGNAQLAESGVAGLSVREIARGLGMVSSAVYRYVASRDELLTLLIVDAYEDLAAVVEERLAGAGDGPRERFLALGGAMSSWALAAPERWSLLYGTPVPGYAAPEAGFFLWLPVADGEAAALKAWRETGVRVLPGAYLGRDVNGENPGKGYVRVAMVAPADEMQRGLETLRSCLYD